ncbi:uncharacterized protein [Spinacia oleracea]|uniref:Uncharacterized protein isoform X3 n=1 Tax=Spinacia oleracea TaxID=3562 RepID=A0ABM3RBU5_SPIOL|nr:uncharacterized protein LOC110795023 isoform X3 [Spinacia oleracea]
MFSRKSILQNLNIYFISHQRQYLQENPNSIQQFPHYWLITVCKCKKLTKKMRENRSIPHRMRVRSDNTIRYNAKRMHWCRTKLREISEEEGRIWWWEELINGGSTIRDKYGEEED